VVKKKEKRAVLSLKNREGGLKAKEREEGEGGVSLSLILST